MVTPSSQPRASRSCGYQEPGWIRRFDTAANPPRPAGRLLRRLRELRELDDGARDPFFHLIDGGVSDNLGLRGVLDVLETFEALRSAGVPTPLDHVRRIIIFVVNSVSIPSTDWNRSVNSPAALAILTKAAGVPIERYADESVELLKDIDARWALLRRLRRALAARKVSSKDTDFVNAPDADIHTIDVSFQAVRDPKERAFLNQLPTSFALSSEAVDRLRRAASTIILQSPVFQEIMKEERAQVADSSSATQTVSPAGPPR